MPSIRPYVQRTCIAYLVWMMRQSIARIGPVFNSPHMMRRCATEAYLR